MDSLWKTTQCLCRFNLCIPGSQESFSGRLDSALESSPGLTLITRPSDNMYHISLPAPPSEAGGLCIMMNSEPFLMPFPVRLRIRKKNDDPAASTTAHMPPIKAQGTAVIPAIGIGVDVTDGVVGTCASIGSDVGAIVNAGVDAGSNVGVITDAGAAVWVGDSSGLGVAVGLGITVGIVPPPPPPTPPPAPPGVEVDTVVGAAVADGVGVRVTP